MDSAIVDQWHPIGCLAEMPLRGSTRTRLLGRDISIQRIGTEELLVQLPEEGSARELPTLRRYGFLWTSLGRPAGDLFPLPEWDENDRRNMNAATFGIKTSAPRAVENFLDMAHFPFVHGGYLGEEPYTEVGDYTVETKADGDIWVKGCVFYQPKAAATATEGFDVEYMYRVPHPYCAVLYKTHPVQRHRMDVMALFAQPLSEEEVNASLVLSLLDVENSDNSIRRFQQTILAQDKPILENQMPRRLPLDPRAEMPVRADAASTTYRRWLQARSVRYGTIPSQR
jgi:phenylpropionate dioxygenase-like ring-hydroxylating dioxygenase large terminal subunit